MRCQARFVSKLLGRAVAAGLAWSAAARGDEVSFRAAKPIWPAGRETEMNLLVGFRAVVQAPRDQPVVLRLTASTIYRAWLNGEFLGYGPARGPHDWFRLDEWDLRGKLRPGDNVVAIEVAGYNCNCFYLLDQPSFLQAEVVSGDRVLAATAVRPRLRGRELVVSGDRVLSAMAGPGVVFQAKILDQRVQKVSRFSYQRTFSEVYRLTPGVDDWRARADAPFADVACTTATEKKYLPRRVPYPLFEVRAPVAEVAAGSVAPDAGPRKLWRPSFMTVVNSNRHGFVEKDLAAVPSTDLQRLKVTARDGNVRPSVAGQSVSFPAGTFRIFDFGTNLSGFVGARLVCEQKARVLFTFDELLTAGDVDFKRLDCMNVVGYELEPGAYDVESIEPNGLRFLKITVLDGACRAEHIHLREYANPDASAARFSSSDRGLNAIFEAARQTFRQNAVDLFMDCPTRERAGWANDAYWTARAGFDLCGNTKVEQVYFEDFLLPEKFAHLPDGMLPMCYPSDHYNGQFIPNCAFWFVLQLEEYYARSGDQAMVDALRPKVLKLFDYFAKFRNSDGLLEKLDSWVFLEWSAANTFVQDVSYPSNMEYAGALEAAGRLYHLPALLDEARQVQQTVLALSGRGEFFVDNAVRKNGQLLVTTNRTELCQYMAFYFGLATPRTHPQLWQRLCTEFGPQRDATKVWPEIHKANAIIGNYLRMDLLTRYGLTAKAFAEAHDYYLRMAELTGTLWEYDDTRKSCNHGFASHAAHLFYRDFLGLQGIDRQNRTVTLRFADLPLEWCEGEIPFEFGTFALRWWREGATLHYRVSLPPGFTLNIENPAGLVLQPHP
jgi:alpha-L-rhamnosidase